MPSKNPNYKIPTEMTATREKRMAGSFYYASLWRSRNGMVDPENDIPIPSIHRIPALSPSLPSSRHVPWRTPGILNADLTCACSPCPLPPDPWPQHCIR